MIGMMAGEVIVQALVLAFILYLVAKHEADYSISKVAMVVAGITLGTFLIDTFVAPKIGYFSLLVSVGFICFMLMTFCWITFWKSLIVVVLFSGFHIAMALAMGLLIAKVDSSVQATVIDKQYEEMEAIKQEMLRQQQEFAGSVQPPSPESRTPPAAPEELAQPDNADTAPVAADQPPAVVTPPPTEPPVAAVVVAAPAPTPPPAPADAVAVTPALPAPAAPAAPVEDAGWVEAKKLLKVGGIMTGKGKRFTAFVNNNLVEIGDIVTARYNLQIYRWKVKDISRSGLTFDPLDCIPAK